MLKEIGRGRLPAGRSPRLLGFNSRYAVVTGVDLGASNLRIALADLDGTILAQHIGKTPKGTDLVARLVAQITQLVRGHTPTDQLGAVVIGTPGVVAGDRIRYSPNLPTLEEAGFLETLRTALPCPLEVHNDVNLAAIGEAADRLSEPVAFLAVGTGLGAAVTIGTQVWVGSQGRAGEIGYLPFASPVGSTLEETLSGTGLASLYRHFGGAGGAREALSRTDQAAVCAREILLEALAVAVSVLSLSYDPGRIVLGGGVGLRLGGQLRRLEQLVSVQIPFVVPVEISRFGDLAAQRGAILLASRRANQELIA